MTTLRIEHPVPSFGAWKRAFDADPLRREASGVRRYRVLRPLDDEKFVTVDLDFESLRDAETFRTALEGLWRKVEGTVMESPRVRVFDVIESREF